MGDKARFLKKAAILLRGLPKSTLLRCSSVYETEPWGERSQEAFLNQIVEMETGLEPAALLNACRAIEDRLGRERAEKWGARTIDIDILLYGRRIINRKDLQIPHPRIQERRFVLVPLAEIAPDLRVPGMKRTISILLDECGDTGYVRQVGRPGGAQHGLLHSN